MERRRAPRESKREISHIRELVARWRFLEAISKWEAEKAETEESSENLLESPDTQQEKIIAEVRKLVPQDSADARELFRFALDQIEVGLALRCDRADLDMLMNILKALPSVFAAELETARLEGMTNMRDFLSRKTGSAFDTAKEPDIMKRIGWGAA
jgi:DNA-directed RNA polymerase subunit F